jgi:hypothetical protein
MIRHEIPLQHLAFFLLGQLPQDFSQVFPQFDKESFLAVFWQPDNVILAFPLGVA